MMKKYFVFILAIVIFACTQQSGLEMKVNIKGATGKVILQQRGENDWIPIDTADIVNGTAVLTGNLPYPGDYYLSVTGQAGKILVFADNTKMSVSGSVDSLANLKVTGSKTYDEYKALEDQINEIAQKYLALYQQAQQADAAGDVQKTQELMAQVNTLYESTQTIQEDYVKNNPSSYVVPFLIDNLQYEQSYEELSSMLSSIDPVLDSVLTIKRLKARVERMEKLSVGQIAPDFTQNDPDGNPVSFSKVYSNNEVTLLDFWAGWCGPCRQENPNVVAIYNDYKDKGFGILGVSFDRTKEDWLKAIKDDGLVWSQVSDLSYWENPVAKLYEVNSIPSNLLVDKNGKILAKNKRGDELRATIAELLN